LCQRRSRRGGKRVKSDGCWEYGAVAPRGIAKRIVSIDDMCGSMLSMMVVFLSITGALEAQNV